MVSILQNGVPAKSLQLSVVCRDFTALAGIRKTYHVIVLWPSVWVKLTTLVGRLGWMGLQGNCLLNARYLLVRFNFGLVFIQHLFVFVGLVSRVKMGHFPVICTTRASSTFRPAPTTPSVFPLLSSFRCCSVVLKWLLVFIICLSV